jgi:hypothetical protein
MCNSRIFEAYTGWWIADADFVGRDRLLAVWPFGSLEPSWAQLTECSFRAVSYRAPYKSPMARHVKVQSFRLFQSFHHYLPNSEFRVKLFSTVCQIVCAYCACINLLKPTVYLLHQLVQHSRIFLSVHTVFICFVFIWEQTATCATYSINWLVFITEMKSIYSAVQTGSLNETFCASSLKG